MLVPTVLALVESERLDGRTALTAYIAGHEGMIRLGMAAPGRFHARGWHATAVCGAFGAALAAGKYTHRRAGFYVWRHHFGDRRGLKRSA